MFGIIEIVFNKFKKYKTGLNYYYQYYLHCMFKSFYFQKLVSKCKGISLAEKENQTLKIKYIYDGKEFEVFIPFERKLISKMTNQTLLVVKSDSNDPKVVIHQPGVPYLITPGHLGGDSGILISLCSERKIQKNERVDH